MTKTAALRKWIVFLLSVVTPTGFLCKLYSGPLAWWFRNYCAGVLYEIFWILAIFLILPRKKLINTIPIAVFGITAFLETLQLWHPPLLESIRRTFVGGALIGTTFTVWDFPHYAVGCGIGWVILKKISDSSLASGRDE
ncbi:MAG: DUF2809 domain-containing protein [Candidatus Omnitrophota bacterium]